jgi:hypothetical protein
MKKTAVWALTIASILIGLAACTSGGGSKADEILTWLPQAAQGVFVVDAHRGMTTAFVDKAIKESDDFAKYQEFIKETGIDPQKDIRWVGVALLSETDAEGKMKAQPGFVVDLTYNKDTLLPKIKEKAADVAEEAYNGVTVYRFRSADEGDKPMSVSFFDATHILGGTEGTIKTMIDVAQKKSPDVLKNETLAPLMKTVNKGAMLWAAVSIPKELSAEAEKSPMTSDLESIKTLQMYFDYKDNALEFEIKGGGADADKNKKLADTLNGFKALGGLVGGEHPEVGELINKIEISSAPDGVKIYANLPEDLLTKLSKTAQAQVEEKLGMEKSGEKKDEAPAEIKK